MVLRLAGDHMNLTETLQAVVAEQNGESVVVLSRNTRTYNVLSLICQQD
jgi:hypothetical protein